MLFAVYGHHHSSLWSEDTIFEYYNPEDAEQCNVDQSVANHLSHYSTETPWNLKNIYIYYRINAGTMRRVYNNFYKPTSLGTSLLSSFFQCEYLKNANYINAIFSDNLRCQLLNES